MYIYIYECVIWTIKAFHVFVTVINIIPLKGGINFK